MNKIAIHKLHQIFDEQGVHGHIRPFPFAHGEMASVSMDFGFTSVFLDSTGMEDVIAFYKDGTDNFEFPSFFHGKEYEPDESWFTHEHIAITLDDITLVEYIMADEYGCPGVRMHMKNGDQYCVNITCRDGME